MSHAVVLDWTRCPDGADVFTHVEDVTKWVSEGALIPGSLGLLGGSMKKVGELEERRLGYRTSERSPVRLESINLAAPVVLRFLNAKTDEALQKFASTYGLPAEEKSCRYMTIEFVEAYQKAFQFAFDLAFAKRDSDARQYVDSFFEELGSSIHLVPKMSRRRGDDGFSLHLHAPNLLAFMAMEMALIVHSSAEPHTCDHCGTLFVTGSATGRRSQAKYCGARCRVAAGRRRKTEASART